MATGIDDVAELGQLEGGDEMGICTWGWRRSDEEV
jgi:hypothetical protein